MTKKQEFIKWVEDNIITGTEMPDGAKLYFENMKAETSNKKPFTENGIKVLRFLQVNTDRELWKSRDIGEQLGVSSRTVSGAMRKLVTDGYLEKMGESPVVYSITEKGKNVDLDSIEIDKENE